MLAQETRWTEPSSWTQNTPCPADCPPSACWPDDRITAPAALALTKWGGRYFAGAAKSTLRVVNSDETFCLRDIQFDNPQVRVLLVATIKIFRKFLFIIIIL